MEGESFYGPLSISKKAAKSACAEKILEHLWDTGKLQPILIRRKRKAPSASEHMEVTPTKKVSFLINKLF